MIYSDEPMAISEPMPDDPPVLGITDPISRTPNHNAPYLEAPASTLGAMYSSGLIGAINAFICHPRGYALQLCWTSDPNQPQPTPEDLTTIEPIGWRLVGDGTEEIAFSGAHLVDVIDDLRSLMPTTMLDPTPGDLALDAVGEELARQQDLWGPDHDDDHLSSEWTGLLATYTDKYHQDASSNYSDLDSYSSACKHRLAQIAALAISAYMSFERQWPTPAEVDPADLDVSARLIADAAQAEDEIPYDDLEAAATDYRLKLHPTRPSGGPDPSFR
jgi:hypothetical protein